MLLIYPPQNLACLVIHQLKNLKTCSTRAWTWRPASFMLRSLNACPLEAQGRLLSEVLPVEAVLV